MKKLLSIILLAFLVTISLVGCKKPEQKYHKFSPFLSNEPMKICVASDLHFLTNQLVDPASPIKKPNNYGDGRIVCYIEELIDAFIYEIKIQKPNCLIITGDLSYNGAYQNHLVLEKKLQTLVDDGIRVLVIPGNHDLNTLTSVRYNKDNTESVKTTTSKDFKNLYYDCGYGNAVLKDEDSLSYAYQLSDDLLILMLDSCIYKDNDLYATSNAGILKDTILKFIEEALIFAQKNNLEVISTSHHNLLVHNDLFVSSYQIKNYKEIIDLYNRYNVLVNLSGHMHIQHYKQENNITEILTSSLAIYANQYGIINYIPQQEIDYQTKMVDVNNYAKTMGINNNDLNNFDKYSFDFFTNSSYWKTYEGIMFDNSSFHLEADALGKAQSILNPAYFSGKTYMVINKVKEDPSYEIWSELTNFRSYNYLMSMMNDSEKDYNSIKINLNLTE